MPRASKRGRGSKSPGTAGGGLTAGPVPCVRREADEMWATGSEVKLGFAGFRIEVNQEPEATLKYANQTLAAVNLDQLAVFEAPGRFDGVDDGRQAQLARHQRGMTGAAADVDNQCSGQQHQGRQ